MIHRPPADAETAEVVPEGHGCTAFPDVGFRCQVNPGVINHVGSGVDPQLQLVRSAFF